MLNVAIGYDSRFRMPAYTAAESILQNSSQPVNFTFLNRKNIAGYCRQMQSTESTEFSISRFLTPWLHNFTGWTLFVDNDVVVLGDIAELFAYSDPRYAVLVVKNTHTPGESTKFLGNTQSAYQYKNWSSVMLFNNHLCKQLTPDYVNSAPGLDLHQFKWLHTMDLVGSLPLEWNYLVDCGMPDVQPKLIHYTNGGPWFPETANCSYAGEWFRVLGQMQQVDVK